MTAMTAYFMGWNPDADVYGEAAGLMFGDRFLDLVYTRAVGDTFPWDVVDGCDVIAKTAAEARRAAENAGRRALIRIAA